MSSNNRQPDNIEAVIPLPTALFLLFVVFAGTVAMVLALPAMLPGLLDSFVGTAPKAFWYLARVAGIISYVLIWFSIAMGLLITNKFSRVWPGGPLAVELHQFASLVGLAFALFHGIVLLGDQYVNFTALQLVIPFATASYRPFWVGLGQLAFYLMIPVTFSFYLRKRIGYNLWRVLHYGSFAIYALTTIHGLLSGTDTANPFILGMYAATGAAVFFLTIYRTLNMVQQSHA
ncbi:MAG: ferric reductase-like transmembrane domain-containing protein [Anaerolineae bacterium]